MKRRKGFVSNSSSSSYLIMIPKSNFEDVLNDLEEDYYKDIIRDIVTQEKVLGITCLTLSYFSGNLDTVQYFEINDDLESQLEEQELEVRDEIYKALYNYKDAVYNNKLGFVHSEDC